MAPIHSFAHGEAFALPAVKKLGRAEGMGIFGSPRRSSPVMQAKSRSVRMGAVYLLSQEGSTLIRLEKVLKADEARITVDHDAYWKLPAEISKKRKA